jgi:DNA polymerase elongation subunit (family B)
LEVRKSDTPAFIFNAQTDMIDVLSSANNTKEVNQKIPEVLKVARTYRQKLVEGEIPVSDLMVTKHLSKNIKDYKQQISQVIAAKQLVTEGVEIHAGDNVTFLFTHSQSKHYHRRVVAQQLSSQRANCDVKRYLALLYLSAANLLNFAGYNEKTVCAAVNGQYIGTLSKYLN